MRNSVIVLVLFLTFSFLITPILSQGTTSKSIQSQGEIMYAPAPMPQPQLRVNGLYLEDGLGNRVTLRGIQACWNEKMKAQNHTNMADKPEDSWFTLADVNQMKTAGANEFEAHGITLASLMPTKNVADETFFSTWIDKWVSWCSQNQMYCTLSIQSLSYAGRWMIPSWLWENIYSQPTTQADWDTIIRDFFDLNVAKQDSNRDAFINLWKFIANRYKDNPYVMFSIMNEPLCLATIPDAATCTHLGQTYSKFMENVVDGIRSVGANQIVIIDRPYVTQFSYNDVQPVNRDGIMWEEHIYMETLPNHGWNYWTSWIGTFVNRICGVFKKPLFIGEYGFDPIGLVRTDYSTTWKQYLANMAAYIDNQTIVGRQFHCWDYMFGEYCDSEGTSNLTAEESSGIIQAVLS
jgi:hypothetical protein